MRILGIDYGRKKIGFAFAESFLADPIKVVRIDSFDEAVKESIKVVKEMDVQQVVVGISEGEMGKESAQFVEQLKKETGLDVLSIDETLTSQDAQSLAKEANMRRTKIKGMEDAFAASLILQNYLDSRI